jgi:hypothetical protein
MAVQIKEIAYGSFGRCVQLTNGLVDLVVTVGIGPRIIRYGFVGRDNMFCEAPDETGPNGWRILGGHRLWHSPEHARTYELENKAVKWEKIENGIRTVQETEPWAMMAKEMDIVLDDESAEVSIVHRIRNCGAWPVEFSIWSLSVVAPGGKEVVPMTQRDTGLLGNRMIALWPYSRMNDERVWWGERYITLQQDPSMKPPFKFGINNEYGWAAYFNYNQVFIKQFMHELDEKYPDGGASYETYTTDYMLEMESLSPLQTVQPGEEIDHMESWYLVDEVEAPENSDDSIDEIMDELLGDCCDCDECSGCGDDEAYEDDEECYEEEDEESETGEVPADDDEDAD